MTNPLGLERASLAPGIAPLGTKQPTILLEMPAQQRTWVVILAAGDGTRLAPLTTNASGEVVPKQFCSLDGNRTLLQDALNRATPIAPSERQCVIVSTQHHGYWAQSLGTPPSRRNVIVQPRNRGTAYGILLSVLAILERDPLARIVFLPTDHSVRDEGLLTCALRKAVAQTERRPDQLIMIGIEPDALDPELGYIVPGGAQDGDTFNVAQFVEKPLVHDARSLIAAGALWNSFIFVGDGSTILGLIREHMPTGVAAMESALARARGAGASDVLERLYDKLPTVDFSTAILQRASARLRVVRVQACGWNDLGTPARVAQALGRIAPPAHGRANASRKVGAPLINLAAQLADNKLAS